MLYNTPMTLHTHISNLLLAILSLAVSRGLFYLIDDPEGPNLLIVTVLAIIIFSTLRLIWYWGRIEKNKQPRHHATADYE